MNSNELRLGNKVLATDTHNDGHIISVNISVFNSFKETGLDDNPNINPVKLTGEWLKKLGFKSNYKPVGVIPMQRIKYWCDIRNLEITFDDGKCRVDIKGYCSLAHIKYVHQLQNLYFALTGEELDIKETVKV